MLGKKDITVCKNSVFNFEYRNLRIFDGSSIVSVAFSPQSVASLIRQLLETGRIANWQSL